MNLEVNVEVSKNNQSDKNQNSKFQVGDKVWFVRGIKAGSEIDGFLIDKSMIFQGVRTISWVGKNEEDFPGISIYTLEEDPENENEKWIYPDGCLLLAVFRNKRRYNESQPIHNDSRFNHNESQPTHNRFTTESQPTHNRFTTESQPTRNRFTTESQPTRNVSHPRTPALRTRSTNFELKIRIAETAVKSLIERGDVSLCDIADYASKIAKSLAENL